MPRWPERAAPPVRTVSAPVVGEKVIDIVPQSWQDLNKDPQQMFNEAVEAAREIDQPDTVNIGPLSIGIHLLDGSEISASIIVGLRVGSVAGTNPVKSALDIRDTFGIWHPFYVSRDKDKVEAEHKRFSADLYDEIKYPPAPDEPIAIVSQYQHGRQDDHIPKDDPIPQYDRWPLPPPLPDPIQAEAMVDELNAQNTAQHQLDAAENRQIIADQHARRQDLLDE